MPDLVVRDVLVDGRPVSVALTNGRIVEVGAHVDQAGAVVVDGDGCAAVPGLHDHHIHLLATAAARRSVDVGPAAVADLDQLGHAVRAATPHRGWVRAVGYHESVAGDLDGAALDRVLAGTPLRVQHRSGARWTLNRAGLDLLTAGGADHPGLERDPAGQPTGRLHRGDDWLRRRLGDSPADGLAELGADLLAWGVASVTDLTPSTDPADFDVLADAVGRGILPQQVTVTGGIELATLHPPVPLRRGPVKLVVDDGDLPGLDDLAEQIRAAHRAGRPVAVHLVTRAALLLALAAWDEAGTVPGDRVEHGSVIPPEVIPQLAGLGLTVVTQPGFVADRGDRYLADVDRRDLADLYRSASLIAGGVAVGAGTDAPYASPDPWRSIRAAVARVTPTGTVLGPGERVDSASALALFLGEAHAPGRPRRVRPGARGDLCLLDRAVLAAGDLDSPVVGVVAGGRWTAIGHRPLARFPDR